MKEAVFQIFTHMWYQNKAYDTLNKAVQTELLYKDKQLNYFTISDNVYDVRRHMIWPKLCDNCKVIYILIYIYI